MKRRCIIGAVVGIVLCAVGVFCGCYGSFGMRNVFLVCLGLVLTAAGAFIGRWSLRGLIGVAVFNRKKEKELEKLEAIYSGGGISQEEYFAKKIALLNAEYGDS